VAEGLVPVDKPWTLAGKFNGKLSVVLSGTATLDPAFPGTGPDGLDKLAPSFFTLPGERMFCALARHNGKIEKVGVYKDILLESESELWLGPNEDASKRGGAGFDDNSGSWSYRILSLQENRGVQPDVQSGVVMVPSSSTQPVAICTGKQVCEVRVEGRINYGGRWADANTTVDPAAYDSLAPGIPFGTLVGKVGKNGAWFQVGGSRIIENHGDTVYLMVNDSDYKDNSGSYTVYVK
jgi:hypothetical protein